jgi:hypothetical protein
MHIEEEKSRILKDEEEQQEHQKKDPSFILNFKARKIWALSDFASIFLKKNKKLPLHSPSTLFHTHKAQGRSCTHAARAFLETGCHQHSRFMDLFKNKYFKSTY